MNPTYSPADSLLSPHCGVSYPLFNTDGTISPAATALTPQSFDDTDRDVSHTPQPSESSDKKPVKKRKSWGQELPAPKTNLPPRKRAKTEDEKEQRRIERVLRNRAAAQSSRERKRKEVEGLEDEKRGIEQANSHLASRLRQSEVENMRLQKTIKDMAAQLSRLHKITSGNLPSPDPDTSKVPSPSLTARSYSVSDSIPQLKSEFDELDNEFSPPQPTVDPRQATFSSPSESPEVSPIKEAPMSAGSHTISMGLDLRPCSMGGRPTTASLARPMHDAVQSPLGQPCFNGLFATPTSAGADFPLFDDGCGYSQRDIAIVEDLFSFDNLVNLDAEQGMVDHQDLHTDSTQSQHYSSDQDFPDHITAKTTGLQPGFGAPFEGRDGPGIAADV